MAKVTITAHKDETRSFRSGDIVVSKITGNIYLLTNQPYKNSSLFDWVKLNVNLGSSGKATSFLPEQFYLFKGTITLENDK